jgi:hypothetical protein
VPVIVVLGLLAVGTLAFLAARRAARRTAGPSVPLGLVLTEALEDTLDDVRAETDPRRAVVAAYARMERVLAANGVARHDSEAPEEYLARVLRDLEASADSAARLTRLFALARFSRHDVHAGMKDEAIAALEALREELRAAAGPAPAPIVRPAALGPGR